MLGLVIPPVSDCFMPTLGAAQIESYLKENHIPCKLYDINAELNYYVLFDENIIPITYRKILQKQSTSFHKLASIYNILSLISGCKITTDDFNCGTDWRNILELRKYLAGTSTLMHNLLNNLPSINELTSYKYIGFSISYNSQVIPALIISNIIKGKNPNIKILFGGSFFYNYFNEFFNVFINFDIIDYVIIGRGESVIKDIILFGNDYIESNTDYETTNVNQRLYISTYNVVNEAVVYEPYFDDIDFEIYPTPEKAFPYMIRSSCYYGKCKFCNGDKLSQNDIRKDVSKSFEKMEHISNRIGIKNVYLVDAALSPRDFVKISEIKTPPSIRWIANARFDKPLADEKLMQRLYTNGCKMLRFGLESGSQYVLNLMNKGTNVKIAEDILKYSSNAGIQNHLYIMLGYPGETDIHRDETLEFLRRNKEYIASYSISFFQPIPNTPIYDELKLLISRNSDDEYSEMIDYIYKNSDYYQGIVAYAEKIKILLNGYSQTNGEYYSANIFSGCNMNDRAFQIHDELIFYDETDLDFENELEINVCSMSPVITFWIYDFFNNLKIKITSQEWLKNILAIGYFGSQKNFSNNIIKKYGIKSWELLEELFSVLDDITIFIENYRNDRRFSFCKMIEIKNIKGNKLSNMSIQFSPDSVIVEE